MKSHTARKGAARLSFQDLGFLEFVCRDARAILPRRYRRLDYELQSRFLLNYRSIGITRDI